MRAALTALSTRAAPVGPAADGPLDGDDSAAEDEDEQRVVDMSVARDAAPPTPPAGRVVRMCPSLWPGAREATVYFPYPQKDVHLERSGPLPVAADLGARRLAYRCTWERNCIKNAFGLAGFRRVKDGTELRALKGVKGEASPSGGSGLGDFVSDLLGLAGDAGGPKKKGKKGALDAHVTRLPWCASWTKHPGAEVYATQQRHQRVNHFPGSWCVGRKDRLLRCLGRARSRGGTAAKAYAFMPEGYILPGEARALEGKAKLDKHAVWIVKPPASSCGRGIRLATSRELAAGTLPKEKKYVVQRYVDAPFLGVNGRKFDLRLYCLVTSVDPLVVYVHEDGLVRFSTHAYTMRNLRCRYVHLTNYSVNKKSKRYVEADGDDAAGDDDEGDDEGDGDDDDDDGAAAGGADPTAGGADPEDAFKWPLQALWRWLDAHGHDAAAVRASCADLVVKTLIAAEAELTPHNVQACRAARPAGAPPPPRRPCYELFGFDVLLDADLRPWLIEVNISPSLMGNSVLDRRIKGRLVADVFHTTGFQPFSTKAARKEARAAKRDRLDRSRTGGPAKPAGGAGAQQDAWRRSGRPEDVALERLAPDDWDVVCHTEDELRRARSGGFTRAWPPAPFRYDAADAGAAWTNARATAAAQAAKEKSDAYLPLFECLRFSDCLLARAAQLPVRKLYEHCPLGPPKALVPPPREKPPAPSPKKSLLRAAVSVVKAAVSPRKPPPAAPERSADPRRPGSARRRAAAVALAEDEGAPPPKRPPRPLHHRGTAKTDAALAFRRDRAARSAAPTPADRFRTVDDDRGDDSSWSFDYLSLFSDGGDGRSASASSRSRDAERPARPASAGARRPRPKASAGARQPPRPKPEIGVQLGLEVVRPALADGREASMRW